ncbi:hypothetical protein [Burkholderia pseudomallei]|uniref:hypothetical protein n=1 Tax=Burkholderia pseudomallei TaxID=28450 RepID=UPI000A1A0441|nr:hypothetical protein [Burkholderia pseudomallei]ARL90985.1 hypothetical protein BOC57_34960 [Burkholderia pseudomallei]
MKLDHITEDFALTVLHTVIDNAKAGSLIESAVDDAVTICIKADRAVRDYIKELNDKSRSTP